MISGWSALEHTAVRIWISEWQMRAELRDWASAEGGADGLAGGAIAADRHARAHLPLGCLRSRELSIWAYASRSASSMSRHAIASFFSQRRAKKGTRGRSDAPGCARSDSS
jgi:hypothetical protein